MDVITRERKHFKPRMLPRVTRFLSTSLVLGALCIAGTAVQPAFARDVTLEDHVVLIAFDSHSGALTRFDDKATHWEVERRPKLGDSFRLFAPLPNRRWNPVLGSKQTATAVKKLSDHEILLQWKNLVSENGGVLPLTLTADVTLTNGVLTFDAILENDSSLMVETIDYPYFGDISPPSRQSTNMAVWTMPHTNSDILVSDEIYSHFHNEKGYWGVFWPTKIFEASRSPFCLIQAPGKGIYVGVGGVSSAYRLQYTFEQHPGLMSSITEMVPPADEISGIPVHLEFRMCHLIFQKPHSVMKLAPVVVRCYQGDQHTGSDLLKH